MRISDWSSDVCSSDLFLNIFSSVALKNYPCLLPTSLRCQENYLVSIGQSAAPTAASPPPEPNISMRVLSLLASTSDVTLSISTSSPISSRANSSPTYTCQPAIAPSQMLMTNIATLIAI